MDEISRTGQYHSKPRPTPSDPMTLTESVKVNAAIRGLSHLDAAHFVSRNIHLYEPETTLISHFAALMRTRPRCYNDLNSICKLHANLR
jgi:hypothetical protein